MTPPPPRNLFIATVAANLPLCREHFRLILSLQDFPRTRPGQFIQIACNDIPEEDLPLCEFDWGGASAIQSLHSELTGAEAILRRPFSLAGRRDLRDCVELDIIHRVVGLGTRWLAELSPGDRVGILGPLGNVFEPPAADSPAILIGGGVGIPPMLYLAEILAGNKAIAFAGAVTRDLLPLTIESDNTPPDTVEPRNTIAEFSRHKIPSVITTDDGSFGFRGFVTQALEKYLDRILPDGTRPTLYTCGPEPMMKRVADIALRRSLPCQVAVERAMACGMGTCQSCCIRVRKKNPALPPLPGKDWCYRLACTDGPIFQASELLW
jgi:dihydroorotate dehydrogenase electron transfer subunit